MEYNVILQRMLARLPSRYDKREGSVLYTLLAPVAWAIAQCHYILSWAVSLVFPDTATGDFLDLSCSAFGLDRARWFVPILPVSPWQCRWVPASAWGG